MQLEGLRKEVMNHVVCVKWGNQVYPSKYANVLNSMVKRHTKVPYQFHCLTDDPTGLDADINVIKTAQLTRGSNHGGANSGCSHPKCH